MVVKLYDIYYNENEFLDRIIIDLKAMSMYGEYVLGASFKQKDWFIFPDAIAFFINDKIKLSDCRKIVNEKLFIKLYIDSINACVIHELIHFEIRGHNEIEDYYFELIGAIMGHPTNYVFKYQPHKIKDYLKNLRSIAHKK